VQGDGKFEVTQSKHRLTEDQKHDDGQKLFDFCAECLKNFINTTLRNDKGWTLKEGEKIPLGFTVRIFIRMTNGVSKHSEIVLVPLHVRFGTESLNHDSELDPAGKIESITEFLFDGQRDSGHQIPKDSM